MQCEFFQFGAILDTFKSPDHVLFKVEFLEIDEGLQVLHLRDVVVVHIESRQILEQQHGRTDLRQSILEQVEDLQLPTYPDPVFFHPRLLKFFLSDFRIHLD